MALREKEDLDERRKESSIFLSAKDYTAIEYKVLYAVHVGTYLAE